MWGRRGGYNGATMSCEQELGYNNVIFTHLHCHATVGGRMGFMDYIFSFEIHNTLFSIWFLYTFILEFRNRAFTIYFLLNFRK